MQGEAVSLTKPVWKLESGGVSYCKRIVLNGRIVGLADQLSNGSWIVSDTNGKRYLSIPALPSAARCLTAFKNSEAGRQALKQGAPHVER
jgi:hypothetical protein